MRYGGKRQAKIRPEYFRLDATHSLATGLFFAGLAYMGSLKSASYHDSCAELRGSAAANHGTLTNMDPARDWVWSPVLGRWGLQHDGTDAYTAMPRPASIVSGGPWSVSMWAQRTSGTDLKNLWSISDGTNQIGICYWGSAFNGIVIRAGTTASNIRQSSVAITQSDLNHFVFTHDGTAALPEIWSNGINVSQNVANSLGDYDSDGFYLSRGFGGEYYSPTFYADVMLHDRVISSGEIKTLADRSDPFLGGLILPPRRKTWAAVSVTTRGRILGCGTGHILGA